jgi:ATP-dependent DNA helicase 2 subunit 1
MRTYYSYGGERVYITKAEMQLLKQIGESGLELMGFKPMATLQPCHNVKNPAFIYPDEQLVKGSTVAFKALLQEMHLQQKYAVARLVFRKTGVPRFVALLPQMEQVDEGGFQTTPPGMNLIHLPFADEVSLFSNFVRLLNLCVNNLLIHAWQIRQIKTGTAQPHADTELVKAATQIVRALRLPSFEPDNFVNPALQVLLFSRHSLLLLMPTHNVFSQRHYRVLEALALHEQLSGDASADDRLQPDVDGFARAAPVIEQFEQCWEKAAAALPPPSVAAPKAAAKRAAPAKRAKAEADDDDDESAPRAKKSKKAAAPASDAAGGADVWRAKCADGSVAKSTVAELKEVLKGFGLKVSGAKGELVDRLTDYFISQ